MKPVTDYRPRIADQLLRDRLRSAGAVHIVGPKWCGKTTTALRQARSALYFQDPDQRASLRRVAAEQPSLLLDGDKPRLLDEWQDAPTMWDAVRFAVDRDQAVGDFILTGSSVPIDTGQVRHSGTGRFSTLVMRPMSLWESGESDASVSLAGLAEGTSPAGRSALRLEEVARLVTRGGWPASVNQDSSAAQRARDYVESVIESDVSRVDGVDKNPRRVRLLMRSLARNESTDAAMTTLQADMAADEGRVSTNTIAGYLTALRRLYLLDDQEPWASAVRSKTAIRHSPVRRYCDPSLPVALLGLTPDKLLVDFNTFGLLFESLVVRDLRVYAAASGATVGRYRDARGLECDAIVEWPNGRWGAVEIKLESTREDQAADTLRRVAHLVRSQHGGSPAFLAIVTATGFARQRADGVHTVPIGLLGP
jgi:predicted AAA+ superfamily ATPase